MARLHELEATHFIDEDVPHGSEAEGPVLQSSLLELVWRNRWLILLFMLLGAGGAFLYLQRATPLYTSTSRVYVERSVPQILEGQAQTGYGAGYVNTQAELIQSTPVLSSAVSMPGNHNLSAYRGVHNPAALLKSLLQVSVGQNDGIIDVSIELPDPHEAAQIVNSVVESYISRYAEDKSATAAEVLRILRNEKEVRDRELDERRRAMQEFREANTAFTIEDEAGNVITRRFSLLADQLSQAEIELLQAKTLWERVESLSESPDAETVLLKRAAAYAGVAFDSEIEARIQETELRLLAERSEWADGHPRVRVLQESLADLNRRAAEQKQMAVQNYIDSVRQEYLLLESKVQELRREYDQRLELAQEVSAKAGEFASLKEAFDRAGATCDIIDQRIKEINLTEDLGAMNVTVIEFAEPARTPSYPQRPKVMSLGVALGLLSGLGLVWLRDFLDHRLRSVDEVGSVLQLPVLGVLPQLSGRHGRQAGRIVAYEPQSAMAEAVRTLRTAIHFGLGDGATKVLLVTSPTPGDGKSTVASSLAIAMAQADQSVLLIDADLRKPTQHTTFGLPSETGLSTVLSRRQLPGLEIVPSGIESLDVLPCGPIPPNPVELLNNGYFSQVLDDLQGRYDKIIIDSAPIMPVADSRILGTLADATILVLRLGKSTRRASLGARNELSRVRTRRIGVVVNGAPHSKASDYGDGYTYGGYGYGSYGDAYAEVPPQNGRSRVSLPSQVEAPVGHK